MLLENIAYTLEVLGSQQPHTVSFEDNARGGGVYLAEVKNVCETSRTCKMIF